jgi:hypothetical protein
MKNEESNQNTTQTKIKERKLLQNDIPSIY